jgi:hypothetical protein
MSGNTVQEISDVAALFQSLDAPFIRYDKKKVDPIVWQAKDFVVLAKHEVKVPSVAGSTVKYSFSTVNGDISFGLQYMTSSNVVEVIRETMREPSDVEPIKGFFKADYDGVFIFIFDNTFSWFTDKLLSFNIQLFQPALALADTSRALQCRRLLGTLSEESKRAKIRLVQCKERSFTLTQEIGSIESRISELQEELNKKQALVAAATKEFHECSKRIEYNEAKKTGICIRCLEKKTLSHVLSYLGKQSEAYIVCKYWKSLIDDLSSR